MGKVSAEGVLWAPKDHSLPVHPGIEGVKNLYVIKAMQSFESKEYVTCRYAWRNLYWFLTDAGIEYLREYLNIPAEVVPATLMKSTRYATPFPLPLQYETTSTRCIVYTSTGSAGLPCPLTVTCILSLCPAAEKNGQSGATLYPEPSIQ